MNSDIPPVLASGDEYPFDVPIGVEMNDGNARLIQEAKINFWLHFSFTYRDIFGNWHETSGRWQHNFANSNWTGDYEKGT